eukprot:40827_1
MKSNILRIGLLLFMLAGQFIVDVSGADTEWNSATDCGKSTELVADTTTSQGVLYFTNNNEDDIHVRVVPTVTGPSSVKSVESCQTEEDKPSECPTTWSGSSTLSAADNVSDGKYAVVMEADERYKIIISVVFDKSVIVPKSFDLTIECLVCGALTDQNHVIPKTVDGQSATAKCAKGFMFEGVTQSVDYEPVVLCEYSTFKQEHIDALKPCVKSPKCEFPNSELTMEADETSIIVCKNGDYEKIETDIDVDTFDFGYDAGQMMLTCLSGGQFDSEPDSCGDNQDEDEIDDIPGSTDGIDSENESTGTKGTDTEVADTEVADTNVSDTDVADTVFEMTPNKIAAACFMSFGVTLVMCAAIAYIRSECFSQSKRGGQAAPDVQIQEIDVPAQDAQNPDLPAQGLGGKNAAEFV